VARHLVFWGVLVIGFFIQSLMPGEDRAVFSAWMSVVCFFPSCVLAVYVLAYYFLPRFLEYRRYVVLLAGFITLFAVCLILNFYTSILFYTLTCNCDVSAMPDIPKIGLGFVNTTHALTIGGLVFGIRIGKDWRQKQKESLQLSKQKVANELRFQKSLVHPQFLFSSLDTLHTKILSDSADSPDMLLKLSDLLSYTLYEGMEQQVLLEKEIAMMQAFVDLEKINRRGLTEVIMTIDGDPQNKTVSPLLLLSLLQACLNTAQDEPVYYLVHCDIDAENNSLRMSLTTGSVNDIPIRDKTWLRIVNTVSSRMAVFPCESFSLRSDSGDFTLNVEVFLGQGNAGEAVVDCEKSNVGANENP
jgi:hypothetical protein